MNVIPLDEPIAYQPDLPALIARLKLVREQMGPVQSRMAALGETEAEIKAQIHALMEATGINTGEAHDLQVQLKTRKGQAITDEIELLAAITEAGLLEDFTKFDRTAAAKYAFQHEMPGVEATTTTYLSVSEVK